jgi:hypothetical protein
MIRRRKSTNNQSFAFAIHPYFEKGLPMSDKILRDHLKKILTWSEAHTDWKTALADFPASKRGVKPQGMPHSAWELLEHARITQWDILNFCVDPKHVSPEWPLGYWPKTVTPPNDKAWKQSAETLEKDMQAMETLVMDAKNDLFAPIAHGSGQTILREILLLADHSSYHLGQFVLVRRLLGAWPAEK